MPAYLDFNATTPLDKRVLDRMAEVYTHHFGNADSRTHLYGAQAKELVSEARATIGEILGVGSDDLLFTSGATESNNMAILGLAEYARETGRTHFITTAIEHKSVLGPMKRLERQGFAVDFIAPAPSGRVAVEQVMEKVTDKTLLVSVMQVNSETGVIQPIRELGEALSGTGAYFHVDATQGFGKRNDELRATKYDMLSINAHKLRGPQGVGAFVYRRDAHYRRPPIQPLFCGGQQERGVRPGTTPVALVAGFALAARLAEEESALHLAGCRAIREDFFRAVAGLDYRLNGDPAHCVPSTVNISFAGVDAEGFFVTLKREYAFSNGSACNSDSHELSYVLSAMGLPQSQMEEAVRLSWSHDTRADFAPLADYVRSVV